MLLFRRCSRVSNASRGTDVRIEELKLQNKQLLEELFSLKKAMESKDEELIDSRKKVGYGPHSWYTVGTIKGHSL